MSAYRVILVSREQRDALTAACTQSGPSEHEVQVALAEAFDAAGDQPRIRWCAEHEPYAGELWCKAEQADCRVVDAIVVPLPEQP